jgi:hypothetical protein
MSLTYMMRKNSNEPSGSNECGDRISSLDYPLSTTLLPQRDCSVEHTVRLQQSAAHKYCSSGTACHRQAGYQRTVL